MSSSYKLKLILGGESGSGKTTFLHGTPVFDSPIGVSFKTVECIVNEGDNYTFMVWDLKAKQRFRFLYESFCKGACGAILCFDTSDYESFNSLIYWIALIRKIVGQIPIFLVGTKIDLESQAISELEINELVEKYNLTGCFFTSSDNNNLLKETKQKIFKELVENVDPENEVQDFSILLPKNDEKFVKFTSFFSKCPVCGSDNHYDSLKNFFYSKEPFFVRLKERLIDLIEESSEFEEIYYNQINIGIPCCKCYKDIFSSA